MSDLESKLFARELRALTREAVRRGPLRERVAFALIEWAQRVYAAHTH